MDFILQSYILNSPRETLPAGFVEPAAFESEHGRKRHCKRERHFAHHSATPNGQGGTGDNAPAFGSQCPVVLGKKEIKKWAKYMRRTAHMHKRMAAEAVGAQTEGPESQPQSERPDEAQQRPSQPAFDFSAAASQIQEFLNAFGKIVSLFT
jgi:hypothetical protein